jgi:hypothetical protein
MRALYVGRPYSKQTFARFVLGIPIFGNFDTVVSRQVAQHRLSLTRAHHCKADIRIPEKALIDGTVIAIDVNDPAGHMLAIEPSRTATSYRSKGRFAPFRKRRLRQSARAVVIC